MPTGGALTSMTNSLLCSTLDRAVI